MVLMLLLKELSSGDAKRWEIWIETGDLLKVSQARVASESFETSFLFYLCIQHLSVVIFDRRLIEV